MGILDKILFWRTPKPEYEITDCFGEPEGGYQKPVEPATEKPTVETTDNFVDLEENEEDPPVG